MSRPSLQERYSLDIAELRNHIFNHEVAFSTQTLDFFRLPQLKKTVGQHERYEIHIIPQICFHTELDIYDLIRRANINQHGTCTPPLSLFLLVSRSVILLLLLFCIEIVIQPYNTSTSTKY
jgi:hypothetical protein